MRLLRDNNPSPTTFRLYLVGEFSWQGFSHLSQPAYAALVPYLEQAYGTPASMPLSRIQEICTEADTRRADLLLNIASPALITALGTALNASADIRRDAILDAIANIP